MRFLSLFSGIGGLDLGLERAGMTCVGQVENNPFCTKVLENHWPNVKRMTDIRDVNGDEFGVLDLIAAGFPCQDISDAGKRAGISTPRSGLYAQAVRCIRVARPIKALLENVAALLRRGMGTVLGDLAEIGYDAEWDCIQACGVGAPHERERVFITANRMPEGGPGLVTSRYSFQPGPWGWRGEADLQHISESPMQQSDRWPEPIICRMDVRLPNRVDRLAGVGNSVVPQVAEVIGRAIMESAK